MIYSSIPIKIQLSRMKMIFVLLISIIFFYSCEEEVEIIENPSLVGSWEQFEKKTTSSGGWQPLPMDFFGISPSIPMGLISMLKGILWRPMTVQELGWYLVIVSPLPMTVAVKNRI
ncbi:MAG: hypothetical protein Ct9H300mP29_0490 [Candidatus Neomarinimicrobiota bacterium]|nr:MAG: hypothetical protein Ct9H300mP29_0490 [Candidatus Neomarinimicrobiota bacterium]